MSVSKEKIGMKKGIQRRFLYPTLFVLAIMCFSKVLYNVSWKIHSPQIHWLVAVVFGITLSMSITFGASAIYPLTYINGARPVERILACLVTPFVWNAWEVIRVTEYFPLGVSLYYGLNPLFLGAVAFSVFQMGLWEALCRFWLKTRHGETVSVLTPAPVLSMICGLVGVTIFNVWGMGVHWFYIYGQVYKDIFY